MSEEPKSNPEQPRPASGDAWKEVGRQFQILGDSLSEAFRASWQDEENRRRFQEVRSGVEEMINKVGQTIREGANSPEGQQIRGQVRQAANSMRDATEQTYTEIRPHLLDALRQVNVELQKMIDHMDVERPTGTQTSEPRPPEEPTDTGTNPS